MADKLKPYMEYVRDYLSGDLNAAEFRAHFLDLREQEYEQSQIAGDDAVRAEVASLYALHKQGHFSGPEFLEKRAQVRGYGSMARWRLLIDLDNVCRFTEDWTQWEPPSRSQAELDEELLTIVRRVWASYLALEEGLGLT